MTKNRQKRCSFTHDFMFMGTISFSGGGNTTQIGVHACKKCGFAELFVLKSGKSPPLPPKVDNIDWSIG
jgi:hypothetical protein